MDTKNIPIMYKYKKSDRHGYTYHCPICDAMWQGYPIPGKCKNCGQLIVFEESDLMKDPNAMKIDPDE